jgi:hypothetical protein
MLSNMFYARMNKVKSRVLDRLAIMLGTEAVKAQTAGRKEFANAFQEF